jgi:hypothetical protein
MMEHCCIRGRGSSRASEIGYEAYIGLRHDTNGGLVKKLLNNQLLVFLEALNAAPASNLTIIHHQSPSKLH